MNERALKTLEYDKIIEQLKKYAGSEMGRVLCGKLVPQTDLETIKTMQQETRDALLHGFNCFQVSLRHQFTAKYPSHFGTGIFF